MALTREDERREETELADLLIQLTPESWSALQLEVQVQSVEGGGIGMPHQIISPEGHLRPIIMATDEVFTQTKKYLIFLDLKGVLGETW